MSRTIFTIHRVVFCRVARTRADRLAAQESGYSLTDDELNRAFLRFKDLADKKKDITSLDLASIVNDEIRDVNIRRYELVGMQARHARVLRCSQKYSSHVSSRVSAAPSMSALPIVVSQGGRCLAGGIRYDSLGRSSRLFASAPFPLKKYPEAFAHTFPHLERETLSRVLREAARDKNHTITPPTCRSAGGGRHHQQADGDGNPLRYGMRKGGLRGHYRHGPRGRRLQGDR